MLSFDISLQCEDLDGCPVYDAWLEERREEERESMDAERHAADWQEFWQEIRDDAEHGDNIHRQMIDNN
jgi:hypothetical protein